MLKNLPEIALDTLRRVFNDLWVTGNFPSSWSEATVTPIPKLGKDLTDPGNYRPIALTSCICKTCERLVNSRLVWFFIKQQHFKGLSKWLSEVPQGAILSLALFIFKINSIIKCLPVCVRGSLYVGDFCICFRSKSLIAIERQIHRCINSIQN